MTPTPSAVIQTPELWARHFLKIQNLQGAIIPFVYNDMQRDYMRNRTRRDIIVKPRQIGFSSAIQGEINRQTHTRPCHALTIADKSQNTQKLRRIQQRFYEKWPVGLSRPIRGEDSAIITTLPEMDSSMSIETAGSTSSGRAGTYQIMHGSEVAYWPNPEDVMTGALQSVPYDGWVVLESTANGAQGWFYELCMGALNGSNNWKLHFYVWWQNPEYAVAPDAPLSYTDEEAALAQKHDLTPAQINWRRIYQNDLKYKFPQEYPEDVRECFLLSGQSFFGDITKALSKDHYEPQEGRRYVAGLDFAQTTDYTVLSIGDVEAGQQVHILRMNNLPWAEQRRRILDECKRWGVSRLEAEKNSIGQPNIEALRSATYEDELDMSIVAFNTTAKSKPPLITGLYEGLHSGALHLLDRPEVRREFQAFQASQTAGGHWRYEAGAGEHDDVVIATALMWRTMARPSAVFIEL